MKRTKKVKLFIDAEALAVDHFSGVGHSLLGIVRALERRQQIKQDIDVTLFVPYKRIPRLNEWGFQSIKFREIPMHRRVIAGLRRRHLLPPLDLWLGKGIYFFPNFLDWPLAHSKSITLVHDISFEVHPEFVDPPNQKFLSSMVPYAIGRSDIIATVSPNTKKEIEEHYKIDPRKVFVTPNGVDRSLFYKRDEEEVKRKKAQYGIVGDYFIFVGNIEPRKNLIRMINAYRSLPKEITDKIGLLLIGGGGWQDKEINDAMYQARYDGYKILRPYKFVPDEDLPALYSGAKALIYPPVYEGFGIPPLEAMACQTPVVSTKVDPLPWVVGEAAILVDPYSEEDIARGMQEVLDAKKANTLVTTGLKQTDLFSWEHTADIIVDELISRLVKNKANKS